jgi:hypothetical protein
MVIDLLLMDTLEIINRVKSFGVFGQGCEVLNCKGVSLKRVYNAEVVFNPFLLKQYKNSEPGSVVLEYDKKYLVKTMDGLIKITRYEA